MNWFKAFLSWLAEPFSNEYKDSVQIALDAARGPDGKVDPEKFKLILRMMDLR